ncbi:hypothetical protein CF65_00467 [Aggregatibacter actinomycetemcomitans HK1651]|nr:hypothetical protein CF65_00467 [Aggregatibacter actinomycetemcomitans HK1651]
MPEKQNVYDKVVFLCFIKNCAVTPAVWNETVVTGQVLDLGCGCGERLKLYLEPRELNNLSLCSTEPNIFSVQVVGGHF